MTQLSAAKSAASDRGGFRVRTDGIESVGQVVKEAAAQIGSSTLVEVEGLGDLFGGLPKDDDSI